MASQNEPVEVDQPLPLDGVTPAGRNRKQSRHRIPSRHERAGRRAGVPVRPISLSIPATLAAAWRSYSQKTKTSLVDVMLDAISANKDDLGGLVRDLQSSQRQSTQPVSDGLFLRAPSDAPRGEPDPFVTIPLRMLSTNVDTLDSLTHQTAAESRSQLVVATLSAYLTAKVQVETARSESA